MWGRVNEVMRERGVAGQRIEEGLETSVIRVSNPSSCFLNAKVS